MRFQVNMTAVKRLYEARDDGVGLMLSETARPNPAYSYTGSMPAAMNKVVLHPHGP